MAWQYTPWVLPIAVAAVLSFGLFAYVVAVRRRQLDELVGRAFAVLVLGITIWSVGDVLQLSSTTLDAKRAWLAVQFVGAAITTGSLVAFALAYTDNDHWVTPRTVGAFTVEVAVVLGLLLTSPRYHDLYVVTVGTQTANGVIYLERSLGPAAIAHIVVFYALVLLAIGLLVHAAVRTESVFRAQSLAVLAGVTIPFLVNLVWFSQLGPEGNIDLTVVGFGLAAVPLWYAISRHDLLGISPIARKSVVESMQDAVVVVDDGDRVVDVNPAVSTLPVDPDRDLVGASVTAVLPFLDPVLDPAVETPEELAVETDDGTRYLDASVQSLASADPGSRLVILRDVTEQRRIEERYQRLIEHASDLITVLDADGRISYDSPAVESLLGYEQDEWVGERGRERVHPDDRDRVVAAFDFGTREPGYRTRIEYRMRHADGSYRVFETVATNLLDDPVVEGVVLNSRDVTDRKRHERELVRTNERLDEFASVVSHDLRNPLSVGNGYLELAKDGDREALEVVEETHERMERIIDDALALARERQAIESVAPVSLADVATDAWGTVATAGAALEVDADVTVHADRSRLQRLFENLFRNSVEHGASGRSTEPRNADVRPGSSSAETFEGGLDLTVTVGVTRDADGGGADGATDDHGNERSDDVTGFYVADDGVGIPASERDSVFETGVTSQDDGTGFGLAIVESIANAHDWRVAVGESETGGARFDITFQSGEKTVDGVFEDTDVDLFDDGDSTFDRGGVRDDDEDPASAGSLDADETSDSRGA